MTRPELHVAVANTKNTATNYNENFSMMLDYIDEEISDAKTYVDNAIPTQTGNAGKFLSTNGTTASWTIPVPTGTIMWFGYTAAPSGWVVCNGNAYLRTGTYANLFAVIGTTFGEGDGSTTFNVPNLIGKYVVGGSGVGTETPAATEEATSSTSIAHSHTYLAGTTISANTGSAGGSHTHTYTKGVNSITLLPIIKI